MFWIDSLNDKTRVQIQADLDCSVIHGTLRPCDLVPAFLSVIKNTPYFKKVAESKDPAIQVALDPYASSSDPRWELWETDDYIHYLNEELFDVLDGYAPDGYYFGSYPGDGADFGYWKY